MRQWPLDGPVNSTASRRDSPHGCPQGVREENNAPFVILRCQETEETMAQWPHEFELFYEVALGERDLSLTLLARNVSAERFAFTTSLQPHVGVTDATSLDVRMLARCAFSQLDSYSPHPPTWAARPHAPARARCRSAAPAAQSA